MPAKMWPSTLPDSVLKNPMRSAERKVYRQLESKLDSSFVVYYSRPWHGLRPDGEEIDGECDFVVAHEDLGILVLEVKGGEVGYDPGADQWTSRDRYNVTHRIKSPVNQAVGGKHQLYAKLQRSQQWDPRRIQGRHGFIFPDSATPSDDSDLGAAMPPYLCCYLEVFRTGFREWIRSRFGKPPKRKRLGRDGLRALDGILAKPIRLRSPLSVHLSEDDAVLDSLTPRQFHALKMIDAVPRAAIQGGAGTGKTVLAVEEAQRSAENGSRVLFLCYNRGLASEVRRRLEDVSLITVKTFHALCAEMCGKAGIQPGEGASKDDLLEKFFPDRLGAAFEKIPEERYDTIIVDEGQDFRPFWWAAVDSGLDPGGRRRLRIFHDPNQRLYGGVGRLPDDAEAISLSLHENLRNTRKIHECIQRHYSGPETEPIGPPGEEVEWVRVKTPLELTQQVSQQVTRLIEDERMAPEDMAVLFPSEKEAEEFAPDRRLGNLQVVRCDEERNRKVVVDSAGRFKGLESPVVIVAATSRTVADREMPYVALSRARTLLIVVGSRRVLDRMRSDSL